MISYKQTKDYYTQLLTRNIFAIFAIILAIKDIPPYQQSGVCGKYFIYFLSLRLILHYLLITFDYNLFIIYKTKKLLIKMLDNSCISQYHLVKSR